VAVTENLMGTLSFGRISSQTTYLQSTKPHPSQYQERNPEDSNVYSLDELFCLVSDISPGIIIT
jgi:hypothetical protein